jgi:hypothetical protein
VLLAAAAHILCDAGVDRAIGAAQQIHKPSVDGRLRLGFRPFFSIQIKHSMLDRQAA